MLILNIINFKVKHYIFDFLLCSCHHGIGHILIRYLRGTAGEKSTNDWFLYMVIVPTLLGCSRYAYSRIEYGGICGF